MRFGSPRRGVAACYPRSPTWQGCSSRSAAAPHPSIKRVVRWQDLNLRPPCPYCGQEGPSACRKRGALSPELHRKLACAANTERANFFLLSLFR
jgi:hypothetical protein